MLHPCVIGVVLCGRSSTDVDQGLTNRHRFSYRANRRKSLGDAVKPVVSNPLESQLKVGYSPRSGNFDTVSTVYVLLIYCSWATSPPPKRIPAPKGVHPGNLPFIPDHVIPNTQTGNSHHSLCLFVRLDILGREVSNLEQIHWHPSLIPSAYPLRVLPR